MFIFFYSACYNLALKNYTLQIHSGIIGDIRNKRETAFSTEKFCNGVDTLLMTGHVQLRCLTAYGGPDT